MTSTTTKTISKVAALAAGFALVAMTVAVAPAAHADTTTTTTTSSTTSLQAQIASLQAQLAASQGTSMTATFTRSLTIGSTGSDVTALQNWLISKGFSIPAGATGYFGAQTKAAVAAYQTSKGISPAAGYFGPITMASVNASGSTTTTTTTTSVPGCVAGAAFSSTTGQACGTTTGTTTTGLTGGEGSIDNFQTIGASSTTFNAGDTEQVMGFSFKADGSDLAVNRVNFDVVLTSQNAGNGSPRPWNFFQTATLMDGNTTIATVDATNQNNWSQDGTVGAYQQYRISFTGLNDVVKEGSTAQYYLSFTTQSAVSDSNSGGTYTVTLPSQGLRATDSLGLQQYSDTTPTATFVITNSQNGSAVLSTGSDNPQTTTVQGDSSSVTNGITLNTFTIQAKSAPLELYSIPVTLVTSLATSSIEVRDLKLYQGGTLLDTESVPTATGAGNGGSQTITFTNLNFSIPQGTTDAFSVQADINKIDGTSFTEGATAKVNVSNTNVDLENTSGNTVSLTGASTGNTITFRSLGLSVDAAPTTSVTTQGNGSNTQITGTFNLTFNVTAFGQDIYVSSTTNGFTPNGATALFDGNGNATTSTAASISSTADRSGLNNYVIHSGQTKSITISYTKLGQGGIAQAKLLTLVYGLSDATAVGASSKTLTFPTAYQTAQQYLAD